MPPYGIMEDGRRSILLLRVRSFFASLLAGLVVLLVVEVILIVAGMPSYWQLVSQSSSFEPAQRRVAEELRQLYQQPGRGYRLPGTTLWLYRPFSSASLHINSLGLRGPEPKPRRQDELRVAMLGGSAMYGWLVGEQDTIPALLEAELRRRLPNRPLSVTNLGVEGYRFQQELELLQWLSPVLDSDLVVFYHGANDILAAAIHGGFLRDEPWHGRGQDHDLLVVHYEQPGLSWELRQALKHSRLCTCGLLAGLYLATRDAPESLEAPLPPPLQVVRDELVAGYLQQLAELQQRCRKQGISAVIYLQPLVYARHHPSLAERVRTRRAEKSAPGLGLLWHAVYRELVQRSSNEIPIRDLRGVVADEPGTLFQDWAHLSPHGNRLIAEAIAEDISALASR